MVMPVRRRLGLGVLAEVVLFPGSRESSVGVGSAGQSELVRIGTELVAKLETQLERGAAILVLQHPVFLGRRSVDVRDIPVLEARELILAGQERVRLPVALDLRHLDDGFPAHPCFRVREGQAVTRETLVGKHDAVAEVAVVGGWRWRHLR